jgi:hypothetical protein
VVSQHAALRQVRQTGRVVGRPVGGSAGSLYWTNVVVMRRIFGIRVCLFLASKTMKFDKQFPWSSHGQCNQLGQQSLGFVSPLNPMRASKKAATAQQRFRVRYEFLMAAP